MNPDAIFLAAVVAIGCLYVLVLLKQWSLRQQEKIMSPPGGYILSNSPVTFLSHGEEARRAILLGATKTPQSKDIAIRTIKEAQEILRQQEKPMKTSEEKIILDDSDIQAVIAKLESAGYTIQRPEPQNALTGSQRAQSHLDI